MKKKLYKASVAGAALLALFTWAVAPERADEEAKAPFQNLNFAHRGLHTADRSVPENSLAAFRRAVEAGYGSELDVQLSADGEVFVFHDDKLNRVTAFQGIAEERTWSALSQITLCGTRETIPLFRDVLRTVDGRVPLIVELKTTERYPELAEKTLALLRDYHEKTGGAYCVESFDPRIVFWFRKNAPDVLRGQLSAPARSLAGEHPTLKKRLLCLLNANVLFNGVTRPHFVAYQVGRRAPGARAAEALGAMRVSWTALPETQELAERTSDAVIFQYYEPPVVFSKEEDA